MFTFDFDNGGAAAFGSTTVTNIDDGVRFTLSGEPGISLAFQNGAGNEPIAVSHATITGGATFTLAAQSTANPSLTLLSATTLNPIVLNMGTTGGGPGFPSGNWDVTFLTTGGGTGPQFTNITGNDNLTVTSGVFSGIRFINSANFGVLSVESLSGAALSAPPEPLVFDFDNGGAAAFGSTTVTNIDDGVRFTLSAEPGISLAFQNGAGNEPIAISHATITGGATFTLAAQSTANPSLTLFSATAVNPIVLNMGTTGGGPGFSSGNWDVTFLTTGGGTGPQFTNITGNDNLTVTSGVFSGIRFINSSNFGVLSVETLSVAALSCFCAGTLISTPRGDRAVETLKPGDVIWRADGVPTRVRWLGRQTVSTVVNDPGKVHPICISAGALGDGLPQRDLWLSADHAVEIGGVLYTAGALVNCRTITRVAQMPETFTYYHVETEAHELILAEGVAAETYVDYLAEGAFDNEAQRETRVIPEMDLPRVSSARLVPEHVKRTLMPLVAAE